MEKRAAVAVLEIPLRPLKRALARARNERRHGVLNPLISPNESENVQVGKGLVFAHSPMIFQKVPPS